MFRHYNIFEFTQFCADISKFCQYCHSLPKIPNSSKKTIVKNAKFLAKYCKKYQFLLISWQKTQFLAKNSQLLPNYPIIAKIPNYVKKYAILAENTKILPKILHYCNSWQKISNSGRKISHFSRKKYTILAKNTHFPSKTPNYCQNTQFLPKTTQFLPKKYPILCKNYSVIALKCTIFGKKNPIFEKYPNLAQK